MRLVKHQRRAARGFSLAEVLIALAITGTLLTAALAALDASFKSYKMTTESASTHVVSRMVMNRIMTMLRTGTEFGPYPSDPLDPDENPVRSDAIEFVTDENPAAGTRRVVRIEARDQEDPRLGPREIWYVQMDFDGGDMTSKEERPLLTGVEGLAFTLEYDVGTRLVRATVDMTVRPNDFQDASFGSELDVPTIRLISSVSPRRHE
ncbi:MAG: prepilin-type N-terminal cleavage/methylation domain-containing protein [Phycisphaeraceae bacterium]|nr:prepilin-type N-terminal cleavage/methylation domain-containing protein [Phycisphaeraceae bacterium]